jgi:hypothetical protein
MNDIYILYDDKDMIRTKSRDAELCAGKTFWTPWRWHKAVNRLLTFAEQKKFEFTEWRRLEKSTKKFLRTMETFNVRVRYGEDQADEGTSRESNNQMNTMEWKTVCSEAHFGSDAAIGITFHVRYKF